MDTTTVLTIINMLDNAIKHKEKLIAETLPYPYMSMYGVDQESLYSEKHSLEEFRDHLQGYIESLIYGIESQSTEQ
jgi:hypothetical protein